MVEHFRIPFIIGAGSGSGNILAKLTTDVVKIAINSSWRDLDLLPEEIVKVRAGQGFGSGMDPRKGEEDYLKNGRDALKEKIRRVLEMVGLDWKSVSLIPVIVSAGHGFGSGSGPKIVEDLKKWFPDIPIIAFVTHPFEWEGAEVRYKAWRCGEAIAKKTGTVIIDNEYVRSVIGREQPVTLILNRANQYISKMIDTFLKIATSRTILSSIDMTDLRRVVEKGLVYMLTRSFREGEDLTKICDSDSTMCKFTGMVTYLPTRAVAFIQSPKPPPSTLFDTLKDAVEKSLGLEVSLFKSAVFIGGDRLRISIIMGGFKWWR